MTRRNFARRLFGSIAALCGLAKAGPAQTWSIATKGSTAYAGPKCSVSYIVLDQQTGRAYTHESFFEGGRWVRAATRGVALPPCPPAGA